MRVVAQRRTKKDVSVFLSALEQMGTKDHSQHHRTKTIMAAAGALLDQYPRTAVLIILLCYRNVIIVSSTKSFSEYSIMCARAYEIIY